MLPKLIHLTNKNSFIKTKRALRTGRSFVAVKQILRYNGYVLGKEDRKMNYREILREIDESLAERYDKEEKRWWKKESLVADLLKEYMAQYPEKKNTVRDVICNDCDFNHTSAWLEDIYFKLFDDKESHARLLDNPEYDANLCCQLLKHSKDEDIIDNIFNKLAQETDSEKVSDIYCALIRQVKDEEIYKRILEQTDGYVYSMTCSCSYFSDEFKEKLLHHPNLSSHGWKNLSEYLPDSAFDDEVIERILEKIPTETYSTHTETTINYVLQHILDLRPNAEFAKKVFACCTKLPNYGSNRFCYTSQEKNMFVRIMKLDPSDEMANRVYDYAVINGHTELFDGLLRAHLTADTLQKIEAYYQAHYKEKAKSKVEMKEKTSDKGKKEQFDYVGYYKTMGEFWRSIVAETKDVELLDRIVAEHTKNYRKAWRQTFKIASSYDKGSTQSGLEYEKREFEEALRETGYIKKKLAADYPKLSFDEALAKAFKLMIITQDKKQKEKLSAILNAEGFDFYVNYLENAEGKISPEILDYVLKEKEKMFDKLPRYEEDERERVYEKIKGIEEALHDKGIIKAMLSEKYPNLCYEEAIIREAARVFKSGDAKEKERFNNLLLAEG